MPIRGSIRFFVLVCLLLGLAGVFTMLLPKAAGASGKITVLGSTGMVNIRQGPGTNFPIVSKVARSSQLEYLVQRSGWYQVRLSSGQTGWVAGWLVRQAVPGKGQPAGSNSAPGGVLVVTGSVVNVRGGPGTGYAVTGRVVKGQQLEALEKKGEWYRVRLSSGQTGWVAGWLVRQAVPGKGQPAGSNSAPGGVLVVTGSVVNVRGGPGTGYAVTGRVVKGQQLEAVEKKGDWYRVRLSSGQTGWVAGWLVKAVAPGWDGSPSRGLDSDKPPEAVSLPFYPRVFASPIRVALSLDALTAAFSASGDYALIDGSTGNILFKPAPNNAFTVTVKKIPEETVGRNAYLIQLERDRVFSGNYPGPLILTEGQGGTGNSFQVTVDAVSRHYRGNLTVMLNEGSLLLVNELPLEEYLYGVVPCEMPPLWHPEALKAQAVAARSYALHAVKYGGGLFYDVLATQASQVYRGLDAEYTSTTGAVDGTRGLVLMENDRVVPAFFHSSDGGCTENSEDVWRECVSSIRGRPDPYDRHPENPHYNWSVTYSVYDLAACLSLKGYPLSVVTEIYEIERTSVGSKIKIVRVTGLDENGQTKEYRLGNADLVRLVFQLKAPPVSMNKEYDEETGALKAVTFVGSGWGHALGMSQWGARTMAEQGLRYSDILNFYYRGVTIREHL